MHLQNIGYFFFVHGYRRISGLPKLARVVAVSMFIAVFYSLIVACAILYIFARSSEKAVGDPAFRSFQLCYLSIYAMAVAGDWLQGPHVYALYQSYGMSKHQIELLFLVGFGSSLLFGTIVGSFADKFGRRKNCILYGILYGGACAATNFNNLYILLVGRLLGGIATSILFSAFESWVVFEHKRRGFSDPQLGILFSHAALVNSLVAIISGVAAQYAADYFGYVAPFNTALVILIVMTVTTIFLWNENYGDEEAKLRETFRKALKTIKTDLNVLCLGLIQSLFEGSMYIFVLEWTPVLGKAAGTSDIPHGYIFATFMVTIMMGSSIFRIMSKSCKPESFMRGVLLLATLCMTAPIFFPENAPVIFGAFILFEGCIGIFWPSMGYLRGLYVPEETRSTIINLFRVPLNLIVIFILCMDFPVLTIFIFCVGFLSLAVVFQFILCGRIATIAKSNSSSSNDVQQP